MSGAGEARLDFVLALRKGWARDLFPALRDAASGPGDVARRAHGAPVYPWFAFVERGAQKMLWRSVQDMVADLPDPEHAAHGALYLDPDLAAPDWYAEWDIHLQPGGLTAPRAADVYALGAKLVMLGENDDYRFHTLFAETAIPKRRYRRIIDLGCGFGKSAWALAKAFPDAEVIGVDLSAPCLAMAAARAQAMGLANMRFVQANVAAAGLEAGGADLVTSTMLIHELPIDVLAAVYGESRRMLAPGGALRFLDFQLTGDPLRDLCVLEHGVRNNEPFMAPMLCSDLDAMAQAAGLVRPRRFAFDERGGGMLETLSWPARQDWHFPWAVMAAEAPA